MEVSKTSYERPLHNKRFATDAEEVAGTRFALGGVRAAQQNRKTLGGITVLMREATA